MEKGTSVFFFPAVDRPAPCRAFSPKGVSASMPAAALRLNLGFGSKVMWRWVAYLLDRFLKGRGATASTLRLRSSGLPSAVSTAAGLR
jgi:hypothetical protein